MHIVMLNWRDPGHPGAGGAEVATLHLARHWARAGHRVTWVAASFRGGAPEAALESGITVRRIGPMWALHWRVFRAVRGGRFGPVDLLVDQIHGLPFMTPLYARGRRLGFIHEVAGRIWFKMYPFPVSVAGFLLEPLLLRAYRSTPMIAVSPSTAADLERAGVPAERITVIREGLTYDVPDSLPGREPVPTVVCVGRICAMKQTTDVIDAFALFHRVHPDAQLWIVGGGDRGSVQRAHRRVAARHLGDAVRFLGSVPEREKVELLARAWVLASASVKEGWGLVVDEANAAGTPVATYDVGGFRDSVAEGWGVLSRANTPRGLAAAMEEALRLPRREGSRAERTFERAARDMLAAAGVPVLAAPPGGSDVASRMDVQAADPDERRRA